MYQNSTAPRSESASAAPTADDVGDVLRLLAEDLAVADEQTLMTASRAYRLGCAHGAERIMKSIGEAGEAVRSGFAKTASRATHAELVERRRPNLCPRCTRGGERRG